LHIEGGTGHHYEPENVLIEISPSATNNTLLLTRMEAGGGSWVTMYRVTPEVIEFFYPFPVDEPLPFLQRTFQ